MCKYWGLVLDISQLCAHHRDFNPMVSSISFLTLQLYLNDVESGGETTFFDVTRDGKSGEVVPVLPLPGRILVFQHVILHEGSVLVKGTKYAMRTDVMYKLK